MATGQAAVSEVEKNAETTMAPTGLCLRLTTLVLAHPITTDRSCGDRAAKTDSAITKPAKYSQATAYLVSKVRSDRRPVSAPARAVPATPPDVGKPLPEHHGTPLEADMRALAVKSALDGNCYSGIKQAPPRLS